MHYRRKLRGTPMVPEKLRAKAKGETCAVAACSRAVIAKGLCPQHWKRKRMNSPLTTPIKEYSRSGRRFGSFTTNHGYIRTFAPDHANADSTGYVLAHRQAMADSLGRPLLAHETVHHKNGDRADNRLVKGHEMHCPGVCCNLELWSKAQPYGQRAADKLAWAREIIKLYG